jgi:hypothetical protein
VLGFLRAIFVIAAIIFLVYLFHDPGLQAYLRTHFR